MMTQEEKNKRQREYRIKNGNLCTRKYEKTKKGFLVRAYRNMLSRVRGISPKKHLYLGKEILDKDDFYSFSLADKSFNSLFEAWEIAGYPRKLTPSPNRIDTSKGYTKNNIEWITHSENSRLGGLWSPKIALRG